jgi:hypothetical protein
MDGWLVDVRNKQLLIFDFVRELLNNQQIHIFDFLISLSLYLDIWELMQEKSISDIYQLMLYQTLVYYNLLRLESTNAIQH